MKKGVIFGLLVCAFYSQTVSQVVIASDQLTDLSCVDPNTAGSSSCLSGPYVFTGQGSNSSPVIQNYNVNFAYPAGPYSCPTAQTVVEIEVFSDGNFDFNGGGSIADWLDIRFDGALISNANPDYCMTGNFDANRTYGGESSCDCDAGQLTVYQSGSGGWSDCPGGTQPGPMVLQVPVTLNDAGGVMNNTLVFEARITGTGGVGASQELATIGEVRLVYIEGTGCTLPVELVEFEAEQVEENVFVTWLTASEENNEKFVVEVSLDGLNFSSIGELAGKGTTDVPSRYEFIHVNAASLGNVLYYRLRQVDFDGTTDYSNIVVVTVDLDLSRAMIYPNPLSLGSDLTVIGKNIQELRVYTLNGQLMDVAEYEGMDGLIYNTGYLAKGKYIVIVNGKDQLKLVIQ